MTAIRLAICNSSFTFQCGCDGRLEN